MSEELNQDAEVTQPVPEAPVKAARKKAGKEDDGYPKFVRAAKGFGYTDPETGIRFNPVTPVRIEAAPAEGSWLDCQIKAGYIADA